MVKRIVRAIGRPVHLVSILVLTLLVGTQVMAQQSPVAESFVEVNEAAGIDASHRSIWDAFQLESENVALGLGYLGIGQAWGDYDNDGFVDLFLTGGLVDSKLYRNNGDGTFALSEHAADVALSDSWTGGAVWADYDNDGYRDLYVLVQGANVLFRNEAGRGFRDVTEAAGVGDPGRSSTAAWADYDGDGHLDLFVANWSCFPGCEPPDPARASDRLYHNLGDGTFEDVSHLLGDMLRGAGFSVSFADYDNDGDPDIYVANDQVVHPIGNVLWRNDGPGCGGWCWTDASAETGTGAVRNSMGLAVGDYDNDLDLDIYFSDMGVPMSLLQNLGNRFQNASETAGVGAQYGNLVGWGTAFFDFDNDGWLDLFLATTSFSSAIQSNSGGAIGLLLPHPNVLFRNRGDGTFLDATPRSWQERPRPSLGVAYADYDNDGFVDFVVGNFNLGYTLHRNVGLAGAENHWISMRLEGRAPVNRDAIGARVFVTTPDGMTRMQEVKSGSSLGAGNDTALHFGLGSSTSCSVLVRWPDGTEEAFEELSGDRVWHLVYGQAGE